MLTFPGIPLIAPASILFLGDSVAHGVRTGVTEAQTFREMVAAQVGCQQIDAGVSGDNSAMMLARLPSLLTSSVQICCIMSGINDALPPNNISTSAYVNNLRAMIGLCRNAKIKVLLCTPNAVPGSNGLIAPFVSAMRYGVAQQQNVPLADAYQIFAENALLNGDGGSGLVLAGDIQHPNPTGHALIESEICWQLTRAFAWAGI